MSMQVQVEGYFVFGLIFMGVAALILALTKKGYDWLLENKGYLGYMIVLSILAFVTWTQSYLLADYVGTSKSEIEFLAIVLVVIIIVSLAFRYRDKTVATGKLSAKATRKVARKVKSKSS